MPKFERSDGAARVVNRGATGLLQKGSTTPEAAVAAEVDRARIAGALAAGKVNRIAPALSGLIVDVGSLGPDPNNARLHPERNLEAIKLSLATYGQVKPLVVRRQGRVVMAGNGTLEAARQLGWTRIAAAFVAMTDLEAAGYGMADNRTAELATWDLEVVARIAALQEEADQVTVGWTSQEVMALRGNLDVAMPPEQFPEVDEDVEVDHLCPRCGYRFSGGETVPRGGGRNGS